MKSFDIMLVACLGTGLISCSPKSQEVVIGTWQQVEGTPPPPWVRIQTSGPGVMTFDFRRDGTVITQGGMEMSAATVDGKVEKQGGNQPVTNSYAFIDNETLRITFAKGPRFERQEAMFRVPRLEISSC